MACVVINDEYDMPNAFHFLHWKLSVASISNSESRLWGGRVWYVDRIGVEDSGRVDLVVVAVAYYCVCCCCHHDHISKSSYSPAQ